MQLRLPWSLPASGRRSAPPVVVVDGRPLPVVVTRHRRARRYLLRVTEDGRVRLTVPPRASVAAGLRFVEAQSAWIAREWHRRRVRIHWADGTLVWFRGLRQSVVVGAEGIRVGDLHVAADVGESGPVAGLVDVRAVVCAAMRRAATAELVPRCRQLAAACGFEPAGVGVRDQRTRWGSCSSRGMVSLNWRLIQMPPEVADYVMRHELVHLVHPNHSRRFWRAVEAVCPDWRAGEAWLRQFGGELL